MSKHLQQQDGTSFALDEHGHLKDASEWTRAVAASFAANDGIKLTAVHWTVLEILRDYFQEFEIEPPMRVLVKEMTARGANDFANSLELYRLFPEGPVRQGSKFAGLPLPLSCI